MCGALADYAVVFVEWFQKYLWGPSGSCSSGFRNTCGVLADYAVVFVEWFQKNVWGPSGLRSSQVRYGVHFSWNLCWQHKRSKEVGWLEINSTAKWAPYREARLGCEWWMRLTRSCLNKFSTDWWPPYTGDPVQMPLLSLLTSAALTVIIQSDSCTRNKWRIFMELLFYSITITQRANH